MSGKDLFDLSGKASGYIHLPWALFHAWWHHM